MASIRWSSPITDSENIYDDALAQHLSSPPPSGTSEFSRKPKRPPPITPKRFTKFFTPRSSVSNGPGGRKWGRSGCQLRDITKNAVNSRPANRTWASGKNTSSERFAFPSDSLRSTPKNRSSKKRVLPLTPADSSPLQATPSKRARVVTPQPISFNICEDGEFDSDIEEVASNQKPDCHPTPIIRPKSKNAIRRVLERSFGSYQAPMFGSLIDHCSTWQEQSSRFFSTSSDTFKLQGLAVPFCTTSCNTNSIVAVGDEDGWVSILDTSPEYKPGYSKAHLSFRPHNNALMDLSFSSDDMLLATASGDQTAKVIDIRTQEATYVLAKHCSSVKQISFQPGNDHVLATCSRDGTVQLWDLRCSAINCSSKITLEKVAKYADTFNTITSAHTDRTTTAKPTISTPASSRDVGLKNELAGRRNEPSVTALRFLPMGREHLFLTASDASSTVKLWDIRSRYSRRGSAMPISTTRPLDSHKGYRHFGINSLALSSDSGRFYALSRDSTIYAFSTNHLVLGHSPELSAMGTRQRFPSLDKKGLGPLYGLRHPKFHASTFYVKAALRKASDCHPEMLVVGSSQGCPVLLPTDETMLRNSQSPNAKRDNDRLPTSPPLTPPSAALHLDRPVLDRSASFTGSFGRMSDTIPIYSVGTPLVRGHQREVTSVTWTRDGELVTASDDWTVRRWREGDEARDLRLGGEAQGRRWGCGWAEVDDGFDDEE